MGSSGAEMVAAATSLLDALDGPTRGRVLIPFDDERRLRWSYLPGEREGLALRDMDGDTRLLAHRLLRTALSLQGLAQAVTITAWETVLEAVERRDDGRRDPGRYHVVRLRSSVGDGAVGLAVRGPPPLRVGHPPRRGRRRGHPALPRRQPGAGRARGRRALGPLMVEEDLGRELLDSLDPERRRRAVVDPVAPDDILSGMRVDAGGLPIAGVASATSTPGRAHCCDGWCASTSPGSLPTSPPISPGSRTMPRCASPGRAASARRAPLLPASRRAHPRRVRLPAEQRQPHPHRGARSPRRRRRRSAARPPRHAHGGDAHS